MLEGSQYLIKYMNYVRFFFLNIQMFVNTIVKTLPGIIEKDITELTKLQFVFLIKYELPKGKLISL